MSESPPAQKTSEKSELQVHPLVRESKLGAQMALTDSQGADVPRRLIQTKPRPEM